MKNEIFLLYNFYICIYVCIQKIKPLLQLVGSVSTSSLGANLNEHLARHAKQSYNFGITHDRHAQQSTRFP